jgi:dolichol-phosphate mannosyltransferase
MSQSCLTVVLPTLNEEGNIERLVHRIESALSSVDIIVVDDNSEDRTTVIVKNMQLTRPWLKLIEREGPPCLTASIQAGIDATKTRFVAWMDADLSHPPEVLPTLLREAEETGCSIASRFVSGGSPKKVSGEPSSSESVFAVVLSNILNFLVRKWLRIPVSDYTSGFIVCRMDLLKNHRLIGDYGEYFIELVYFLNKRKVTIREIPFVSPPRDWGVSKTGTNLPKLMKRGVKYLWLTIRLRLPSRIANINASKLEKQPLTSRV